MVDIYLFSKTWRKQMAVWSLRFTPVFGCKQTVKMYLLLYSRMRLLLCTKSLWYCYRLERVHPAETWCLVRFRWSVDHLTGWRQRVLECINLAN